MLATIITGREGGTPHFAATVYSHITTAVKEVITCLCEAEGETLGASAQGILTFNGVPLVITRLSTVKDVLLAYERQRRQQPGGIKVNPSYALMLTAEQLIAQQAVCDLAANELTACAEQFAGNDAAQPTGILATQVFTCLRSFIRASNCDGVEWCAEQLTAALQRLGYIKNQHSAQHDQFFDSQYKRRAFVAGQVVDCAANGIKHLPLSAVELIDMDCLHLIAEYQ